MMHLLAFIVGVALLGVILLDAFETILLPRRINHRLRFSRIYYRNLWNGCRRLVRDIRNPKVREPILGVFGPLSMLGLFGMWIVCLILSFALMQWGLPWPLVSADHIHGAEGISQYVYFSGTTFFTLGLGDISPVVGIARALTVIESGLGLGFLAIIIGYLPVLYQAFSKREVMISLLDARAGSPPSAAEFLQRLSRNGQMQSVDAVLLEWERWCAELLESHISFPVLGYYRSQHGNQSWLAALATMLDSCALLLSTMPERGSYQAQLTLAVARHAAVDISLIFNIRPISDAADRLPAAAQLRLNESLGQAVSPRMSDLRKIYEPFLLGLAGHFLLTLPPILRDEPQPDNWQRSAWMPRTPGIGDLSGVHAAVPTEEDHFA